MCGGHRIIRGGVKQEVAGGLTNRNTKLVHTISYFGGRALCPPKQRYAYNYTIQPLIAL